MIELVVYEHMITTGRYSNHVHVLKWLSKFGSLFALTFTLISFFVFTIIKIIKTILSWVKKKHLSKYVLLAPEDPLKPSIFHKIQNLELFRKHESKGTCFGLFLSFTFPLIMGAVVIGILVNNYYSALTTGSPTFQRTWDFVSTPVAKIRYTNYFTCLNPDGCFYIKVPRNDYEIPPVTKLSSKLYPFNSVIKMNHTFDDFQILFAQNAEPLLGSLFKFGIASENAPSIPIGPPLNKTADILDFNGYNRQSVFGNT
jgi:hypothetical protein